MVQVDIAPTLALLFGVPIPKNNIGVMIPGVIDFLKGKSSPPVHEALNDFGIKMKFRKCRIDIER